MELKWLFVVLQRVQMASVLYVLSFALLVLAFNYYLVPDPSRGVTIVGWCGVGLAVLVSLFKHGWVEFLVLAVIGGTAAWLIQSHGSQVAARRLRKESDELATEQAVTEQEQLERRPERLAVSFRPTPSSSFCAWTESRRSSIRSSVRSQYQQLSDLELSDLELSDFGE